MKNWIYHHSTGDRSYFVKHHSDYTKKSLKLMSSTCSSFGGRVFQQTVGIPMGTNCAPLLAYLFLYSYEAEFPIELEINDTIYTDRSASYLDLHLEIDREGG